MRAFERFLIAFAALAVCLRTFHVATAPVFVILGFTTLALYYLLAFPFLDGDEKVSTVKQAWLHIVLRILSCIALAYALLGVAAGLLGWIAPLDILLNSCIVLAILITAHIVSYVKGRNSFSMRLVIRAGALLLFALSAAAAMAISGS